jgi:hypothetical protein
MSEPTIREEIAKNAKGDALVTVAVGRILNPAAWTD